MSFFENFKILHGLPLKGQKIKFTGDTPSWFTNVIEDSKILVIDQEYTVRKTQLNSSTTYVWLEEFPNIFDPNDPNDGRDQPFFNMASFEWDKPTLKLEDLIGFESRSLGTLNRAYGYGITLNGVEWLKGNPTLLVESGDFGIVTNVKFDI